MFLYVFLFQDIAHSLKLLLFKATLGTYLFTGFMKIKLPMQAYLFVQWLLSCFVCCLFCLLVCLLFTCLFVVYLFLQLLMEAYLFVWCLLSCFVCCLFVYFVYMFVVYCCVYNFWIVSMNMIQLIRLLNHCFIPHHNPPSINNNDILFQPNFEFNLGLKVKISQRNNNKQTNKTKTNKLKVTLLSRILKIYFLKGLKRKTS